MRTSALLLVKLPCCVTNHRDVVAVSVNLVIEETDLTFLELELLVHVNFTVAPLVVTDEVAEHLLAGHLKQVLDRDR